LLYFCQSCFIVPIIFFYLIILRRVIFLLKLNSSVNNKLFKVNYLKLYYFVKIKKLID
jgi:hypothetical protein